MCTRPLSLGFMGTRELETTWHLPSPSWNRDREHMAIWHGGGRAYLQVYDTVAHPTSQHLRLRIDANETSRRVTRTEPSVRRWANGEGCGALIIAAGAACALRVDERDSPAPSARRWDVLFDSTGRVQMGIKPQIPLTLTVSSSGLRISRPPALPSQYSHILALGGSSTPMTTALAHARACAQAKTSRNAHLVLS